MNWAVVILLTQLLEAVVLAIIVYNLGEIYREIRKLCESSDENSDNRTKKSYFSLKWASKRAAKITDRSRKWINEREKKSRRW